MIIITMIIIASNENYSFIHYNKLSALHSTVFRYLKKEGKELKATEVPGELLQIFV